MDLSESQSLNLMDNHQDLPGLTEGPGNCKSEKWKYETRQILLRCCLSSHIYSFTDLSSPHLSLNFIAVQMEEIKIRCALVSGSEISLRAQKNLQYDPECRVVMILATVQ